MSSGAETLSLVRGHVKDVLEATPAYRALDAVQRRALAHDMVKVARYMVDAGGQTAGVPMRATVATPYESAPDDDAPAVALADPPKDYQGVVNATTGAKTAGQRFRDQGGAVASTAGADALTGTIKKVDFPKFVGGLVDGVFNAIVTASIKQMDSYSTLLKNVAKSVDDYMKDNVSENNARDYLASKYPKHLEVNTKGRTPALVPKKGAPHSEMPDFMKDLGLDSPIGSLNKKNIDDKLVPAARRRMAMDRQQLLATMVLMGINRLIVTDGKISAHCMFTLDTTDSVDSTQHTDTFSQQDTHQDSTSWEFLWFSGGSPEQDTKFHITTANDTSSSADIQLHAELGGEVQINFRSETFPLEKMADIIQPKDIEAKAPAAAGMPQPQPPMQLPPPPALPSLPGFPGAQTPGAAAPAQAAPAAPAPAPVGG